ncbi:putative transcriptional regulator, TetR family protein [Pedobacter sp. BAL39]|uniref:TetR/AcrR family transcriptional regulator n=1 Tax=Pedobacter sp. BAL39 TaxID=391596 RepID=UPI000155974A|nr:TetR/AcrR family transcriptional regulator [Pedobacter sp. BAL39]EDM35734.1 putative transcriptional regulator, TetR family protein [Pedobacter sp. BAL39]
MPSTRDTGTEELIKETAKHLFFVEGKLHSTTQEIADAAGVNRTLVNYYFRSRDILFDQVFREAQEEQVKTFDKILESGICFKEKIRTLISVFLKEGMKYPYRDLFLITEMNRNVVIHVKKAKVKRMKLFMEEIRAEMQQGNIRMMNPKHFILNLFSMMAYPLATAPLQKVLYELNDSEYASLMEERKQLIYDTIFP